METTENFDKLIFRVIKFIYLNWSTFLGILGIQGITLKVLLKVLSMSIYYDCLKVAFLVIKPKWYLDTKLVASQQFSSNGNC